ncbi:Hypothetical protein D9617_20g028710 [Elsinoe fawcettii]|nr:Hypothetical protein D9617_20g028710 [Elsinoe fawcettii]
MTANYTAACPTISTSRSIPSSNTIGSTLSGDQVYGWSDGPNNRGSLQIIWSAVFTVFLCTWTVTCLNVPAKDDSWSRIQLRRARWMVIGIFGPEFVLSIASGQWASAIRSKRAFHRLGYRSWTTKHGFFADMGGFHLSAPDLPPFPINAKHLHYLVSHQYLPFPQVSTREISDKSKANRIAKTITILQSCWLLLQSVARWVQSLTLTTLELSAVAIVVCTLATYICWLQKPLDVEIPIVLETPYRISDILIRAGDTASQPYQQSPLDFVDDLGPSWSVNVMSKAGIPSGVPGYPWGSGPCERPIPRLTNDRLPSLVGWSRAALFLVTLIYAAIHVAGWNFSFPSTAELVFWRGCSTILLLATFLYWFIMISASFTRKRRWQKWYTQLVYGRDRAAQVELELETQRRKAPPTEHFLWWEFWLLFLLWCIYVTARTYLIVEPFLGLRALPSSAYRTVEWADLIPHF